MQDPIRCHCLCGRVQLHASQPPTNGAHCHCENCRRAHGAAFVSWLCFDADAVEVFAGEQEFATYVTETDAQRRFCTNCGTTLTFASERWPGSIDLAMANIIDPVPEVEWRHTNADRDPEWSKGLDGLKRCGGQDGMQPLP